MEEDRLNEVVGFTVAFGLRLLSVNYFFLMSLHFLYQEHNKDCLLLLLLLGNDFITLLCRKRRGMLKLNNYSASCSVPKT